MTASINGKSNKKSKPNIIQINIQPVKEVFSVSGRRHERLGRSSDHQKVFRTLPVRHRGFAVELGQLRVEAEID
jgi:hypothetical protein